MELASNENIKLSRKINFRATCDEASGGGIEGDPSNEDDDQDVNIK